LADLVVKNPGSWRSLKRNSGRNRCYGARSATVYSILLPKIIGFEYCTFLGKAVRSSPQQREYSLVAICSNAPFQLLDISRTTLPFKFSAVLPFKFSAVLSFKFRGVYGYLVPSMIRLIFVRLLNALVTLMWVMFGLNIGRVLILVTGA
jgi:hypothetical protein